MNQLESINQFVLYTGDDGDVKLQLFLEDETLWLSQKLISELVQVESHTVNYHIKGIYKSGELEELATTRNFRVVQKEGNRDVSRDVIFYNLDVIIAVGYRVNSKRATQFRIWATRVLREYMIKGFVLDDERLKQGERRIYQQITDIFAECSIDYDPNSKVTRDFYTTVQNKFHYAITGKTAAEIIYSKAQAHQKALNEYKEYNKHQPIQSDFDKQLKKYLENGSYEKD